MFMLIIFFTYRFYKGSLYKIFSITKIFNIKNKKSIILVLFIYIEKTIIAFICYS